MREPTSRSGYAFGEFRLGAQGRELKRGEQVIELQPKPLELLHYLVEHRDRSIGREELLSEIWGGVAVSEAAVASALRDLRRALGDDGHHAQFIQTQRGRGYRFIAEVEEMTNSELPWAEGEQRFVGRAAVLKTLDAALDDALAGRGRVVLLPGSPGIGKTRTAEEFATRARFRGVPVVTAWCFEGEETRPYWPWVQVLRERAQGQSSERLRAEMGAAAADFAPLLPELRDRWPDLAVPTSLQPEEARFRLFDGLAAFLKTTASSHGFVVLIDDLHCADTSSLRLLEFFARAITHSRILVVATYRDEEPGVGLVQALAQLARQEGCQHCRLDGFSRTEVAELVHGLTDKVVGERALDAIVQRTDGNPFFVRELVLLLSARGGEDWLTHPHNWSRETPPGVREIIRGRLVSLPEENRAILSSAAVIGRDFSLEMLAAVTGRDAVAVGCTIDDACRSGIVCATRDGYRFAHGLIQEAVYAGLPPLQRAQLHRTVGEALEAGPEPESVLADLARHFGEAASAPGADLEKAVDYATRAGRLALDVLAFDEAEIHFDCALRALDLDAAADPVLRCELCLLLGTTRSRAGRQVQAKDAFLRAATLARRLGDGERLARAADGFAGQPHLFQVDPSVVGFLEEALAALDEADTPLRIRLLVLLAGHLFATDQLESVDELLREALERSRRLGDPGTTAHALVTQVWVLWGRSSPEARLALASEAVQLAELAGDQQTAARGQWHKIRSLVELGDIAAADIEFATLARRVGEGRTLPIEHSVLGYRAMRALLAGRLDEAETLSHEAYQRGREVGYFASALAFGARIAVIRREQGRVPEFEGFVRETADQNRALLGWRCVLTLLYAETDRLEEAASELERLARHDFEDLAHDPEWLISFVLLAEICVALGDRGRGKLVYERLLPSARLCAVMGDAQIVMGSVSYYVGILADLLGDAEAAERHLRAAVETHIRIGGPAWTARSERALARVLGAADR